MAPHPSAEIWQASPGILFAEDFDDDIPIDKAGAEPATPDPVEPLFSAAELEAARHEGMALGRQAATAEIAAQHSIAAAAALARVEQLLDQARSDAAVAVEQSSEAIGRLVFEILATMLPGLCARHDPAEIAGMVHDLMIGMTPDMAACLSVAPELEAGVRQAFADLPADLARRVVIEPREGMIPGDARLSWEGGSALRSSRRVQQAINEILARLDLLPPPAPPPTPPHVQPRQVFAPGPPIMTAVEEGETLDA